MKHLLPPTVAVTLSTLGCAIGCHFAGMPPQDVKIAALVAFIVSGVTAFGAVLLASRSRRIPHRPGSVSHR